MEYMPSDRSYYPLAVDLWFPQKVRAAGPAPGVEGFHATAELLLDLPQLTYRLRSLSLFLLPLTSSEDQRPMDVEVDGAALRSLSLTELKAGLGSLGKHGDELQSRERKVFPGSEPTGKDDRLVKVAQIYVRESLSGRKPAKGVSESLDAPISTAGHWIRRAKDLGYVKFIRPDDPGRFDEVEGMPLEDLKNHLSKPRKPIEGMQ